MSEDTLFFDAFTQIGPRHRKHPAHAWTLDTVVDELEHCSISGALVASTQSVNYDLMHANLELSSSIKAHNNLFAVWNVMPHHTNEFPNPRKLQKAMLQHNVRAVTIYPKANAWDWSADHSRELLCWLEDQGILTVLERSQVTEWRDIDQFLSRCARLPVLLRAIPWSEQRFVLPLLQKHKNLHITFDTFQINYGLEYLVENGFEDQCIYSSNAPLMSAGAHRCYVDYASVSESARRKIAGGNLVRLLKGQSPSHLHINRREDSIMNAARHGKPLPCRVIDMHMHILHEGLNSGGGWYRMDRGGPRDTFAMLKRLGVSGGGFMSWNGVVSGNSLDGITAVSQCLDVAPKGFWGLSTLDPTHYTQAELASLIPRVYADKRLIGMKPYWVYGVAYDHKSYDVWWRYGNKHHLYALMHRTREDFSEIKSLAKRYPNVRWVVAHCGADFKTADLAIDCLNEFKNVFAEITLTPVTSGIIDYLANHAGADRVLYGSDLPMRDPRQQLGWVVFSKLSVAKKKQILGENALKVIAPCIRRLPRQCVPS
jgi:predicted TIM-barrel fold metal-dependent hydrolase